MEAAATVKRGAGRPRSEYRQRVEDLAGEFGISIKQVLHAGIARPMSADARQVLVNQIRKVSEPHNEPMLTGRKDALSYGLGGIKTVESDDSISIVIPKRPVERMPREHAVALLAVRRAADKAS